jgi:hypothetical protein
MFQPVVAIGSLNNRPNNVDTRDRVLLVVAAWVAMLLQQLRMRLRHGERRVEVWGDEMIVRLPTWLELAFIIGFISTPKI